MNKEEFEQLKRGGKVKEAEPLAKTEPHLTPSDQSNIVEFIPLLETARRIKRHVTSAPTFAPRNFIEQIQFYDDGVDRRLYIYINKTWRYITLT